ncbi:MAG: hypothetical protein HZA15_07585 [Nitrospirae bacterium]|nr:hypothetical protein [Nitrospirota bacterium]
MKINIFLSGIVMVLLLISCAAQTAPEFDNRIKWISKENLLSMLNEPGLILFDARYSKDWRRSDRKIKGAIRLDAHEVEQLDGFYPTGQKIVLYCA